MFRKFCVAFKKVFVVLQELFVVFVDMDHHYFSVTNFVLP